MSDKNNLLTRRRGLGKATIFSFFLLYPLYAAPFLIRSMIKGEKWAYALFSLFLGLLAYLLIPYDTWDITRHYAEYEHIKTLSLLEVWQQGFLHLFLINIMWLVNALGLSKETIPFLFTVASYSIYTQILFYVAQDFNGKVANTSNQLYFLLFGFLLYNTIRFEWVADGLRNPLAFAISLLGVYIILSKKHNLKGTFVILLSGFVHPSAFIFLPLVFIAKSNLNKSLRIVFFLSLIIIAAGLSNTIFYSLIDFIKPYLNYFEIGNYSYFSSEGHWGAGFWTSFNLKTIILEKYIKPMPFYIVAIYLWVVGKTIIPHYRNLLYLLFFVVAIVSISRTLFDRFNYYVVLLFILTMMIEYKTQPFSRFKKIFIVIFISSLMANNLANLYKSRDTFWPSWHKILYVPLPVLFLEHVEPSEYIIRHAND